MKHNKEENQTNFWISYADLMAGLLFVFILIMAGIIIKLTILKDDSSRLESELNSTQKLIIAKESLIEKLKKELDSMSVDLFKQHTKNKELSKQNSLLITELNTTKEEKQKLKDEVMLLLGDLNSSKKKVETLEMGLVATGEELSIIIDALKEAEENYIEIYDELNTTKRKIRELTGLKVKIIKLLKDRLGDQIKIDPKTGSLELSSNILFNQGDFVLKEEAKSYISSSLKAYLNVLLGSDDIKEHIDRITIEGHTNSDGGYLYNLELSQKRAYEVMKYIISSELNRDKELEKYLEASGRSYMDLVYNKNGKEDKEASRRIEIKFNLKNERAINQIEKILDSNP